VIAILGEFDALPELSQEAGVAEHRPLASNGSGHACGHNLLGAGAMLAATAVKDWLAAQGIPGRDAVFADVDAAISWHPAPFLGVNVADSLAIQLMDFSLTGKIREKSEKQGKKLRKKPGMTDIKGTIIARSDARLAQRTVYRSHALLLANLTIA
jgi:hypothetical protein